MRVSSRTSTPRSSSWALAYSCSVGVERSEQRRRHLDQPDAHPGRVDVGEGGGEHGAAQLGQRAGQLHAGGPAADHGDVQVALIHAEPLEAGHQVVTEHDGVGPGIEAERVLRRALDPVERGRHPGRQDEVVVAHVVAVAELDPARRRVDRGQLAAPEDGPVPPREAAGRVGDVTGIQPRGGDLVEQRLEGAVQVAVHQGHPQAGAGEPGDGGQAAETRAADDHVRGVRVSLTSSRDRPHLRPPPRCRYWSLRFSTYSRNAWRSCSVYGGGAKLRGHSRKARTTLISTAYKVSWACR